MTDQEFIDKWSSDMSHDSKNSFVDDFMSTMLEQTTVVISNSYKHVYKCPYCHNYIFFNDETIKTTSMGGINTEEIHCDYCRHDVPLFMNRSL